MEQEILMETESWLVREASLSECSLPLAQRREVRSITSVPFSFGALFLSLKTKGKSKLAPLITIANRVTKRIMFLIMIPLYWLIVFT
ncbi:hypothetical protein HY488_00895, partial [Candidatus Woesearchaeota archaeon]|nr:hypothetical protein [Candidatus Woesearchaeota archaeon]